MELNCYLQKYDWGKVGEESEAARLAKANNVAFEIDSRTPYAELWMGTHPNGPSLIASSGESLNDWLKEHPHLIGADVQKVFGAQLPFLFKVLSVNKALSIQVHPSKWEAEELHQLFPDIYKDPNHKPEMAVALTDFEALCGFRPLDEIKQFLDRIPELRSCMGQDNVDVLMTCSEDRQQDALKVCFQSLMTKSEDEVQSALSSLSNRISSLEESSRDSHLADLVERLHGQFPGDIGVFGPYLFNYMKLRPGEALYLSANEIHAYLYGDCVECMACSDNTVRAGLTPKLKDVPTLCRLLSYICEPADNKLFPGQTEDQFTTVFRPPVPDFAVAVICVPAQGSHTLTPRVSASICLVVSGTAEAFTNNVNNPSIILRRGSVIFLGSQETLKLSVTSPDSLLVFQAMANF
ncbi:mannose-6-phosphate isomerase-like isoform X1 [Macrosteles quadrilineatus]|uniref:mannose-6-phosphate isomerase-like isoform X1 n=2 Tax=Macrosteles quadrilineatus TaxID=74068 RepID=UPI0023E19763|nr:mannose-6-phosphate isomerase-like isoform X1 [Macrosteles quadrilineatus]XP_054266571.1 mannose-6-phosphate isomerase-like isoform X1 [Macrosteles quadrilineatus]